MANASIQLHPDLAAEMTDLAAHQGKSVDTLVSQAVSEYLERQRRWAETLPAIESAKQGRVIDEDVVHAWMERWGTDQETPPPTL